MRKTIYNKYNVQSALVSSHEMIITADKVSFLFCLKTEIIL